MGGNQKYAEVGAREPVKVLLPRELDSQISYAYELPASIEAPVTKGDSIGKIQVRVADEPVLDTRLHAIEDYPAGPLYLRIMDSVRRHLTEWF